MSLFRKPLGLLVLPVKGQVRRVRLSIGGLLFLAIISGSALGGGMFLVGEYARVQLLRAKSYFSLKIVENERVTLLETNENLRRQLQEIESREKSLASLESGLNKKLLGLRSIVQAGDKLGVVPKSEEIKLFSSRQDKNQLPQDNAKLIENVALERQATFSVAQEYNEDLLVMRPLPPQLLTSEVLGGQISAADKFASSFVVSSKDIASTSEFGAKSSTQQNTESHKKLHIGEVQPLPQVLKAPQLEQKLVQAGVGGAEVNTPFFRLINSQEPFNLNPHNPSLKEGTAIFGSLALPKNLLASRFVSVATDKQFDESLRSSETKIMLEFEQLVQRLRSSPLFIPSGKGINSGFGYRQSPFGGDVRFHEGVDFAAKWGEPIYAGGSGEVLVVEYDGTYGLRIDIRHSDKVVTRYAHLSKALVKPGQTVSAGQKIGLVGSSGRSTGPHLHYEVRVDGRAINPKRVFELSERLSKILG